MFTGEPNDASVQRIERQDRAEVAGSVVDPQLEVYTHGYSPRVAAYMAARTSSRQASFILPHLRAGMRLLDCGCGPGSTTVDLAEIVAPGQVEGVDIEPGQIAMARTCASERGASNVDFRVASIYELPFATDSFDAVFAHTVIQHLRNPVQALTEMRRVLVPGGVIGLRDDDWGTVLFEPSTPLLQLWTSLHLNVWTHNGGDPFFGRKHRRLLNEAGFERSQGSSSAESYGSLDATTGIAAVMVEHHQASAFVKVVIEQGWTDQPTLEAMYNDVLAWGQRDDAFFSFTFCETTAWKP